MFTEKELDSEKWKDIDGYDGMYQVSDLGRVRSRYSGEWRVLRGGKNSKGYLSVGLCKDSKQKSILVHRIVANAFIPNSDETKTIINHKNEIKTDNRASNLEWCTVSYNNTYNGLRKKQHHPKYIRDKIRSLYNPNLTYEQNIAIFKANGIECSKGTLYNLRKNLYISRPSAV